MNQIFFVHGGMTFSSNERYLDWLKTLDVDIDERISWSGEYLKAQLPDYKIIKPQFPNDFNAHYNEWKIYFERFIPLLEDNLIIIGNSLGSIFLTRYLSENIFPKKIKALILVGAPFDDSLPDEELCNGFELSEALSKLNALNPIFFFSEDDPIVPPDQIEKYKERLPNATIHVLKDKNGHFKVETFPELIDVIKNS
ncbi:hypothetical protein HN592_04450 [Candidatus Woesearchaeota archaeon]|jgi:predicted alpha/beta hydrolase family esterase|nr:hypothetical protein [Candidatus Woesearchaeota archaeon]MBT4368462.1 hypothetical protein [Candidatus Woesearchaeota archaeon]MBT4712951.1 hypothetical protein [Candidatus Woesearchaeota archaeon]MBT6639863.1 hypothetical protein [Candidatus Woesearchaeota archaeon]MBT7134035.1 hypothetical protein [Candidatus Woesearchaeota archaeon]